MDTLKKRLEGKKIFITGGSSGIGRAIAIASAEAGADVLISYCKSKQEALETVSTMRKSGKYASKLHADLSNKNETKELIDKAISKLGRIDVLINNAGALTRHSFLNVTQEDLRRILEINLIAPFILTQDVSKEMIKQKIKGSIINIGSISAERASSALSHYESAKAGLMMLTKSASLALGSYGIRVNCIQPGLTETEINKDLRQDDDIKWKKKLDSIPLGRVGKPQDHVGAVLFLASDESSWVTGASIIVDGGRSACF